tara:strand:+ start:1350 stop:1628 length:279 start_codon:yes stop_codon:yes gene_type:complete
MAKKSKALELEEKYLNLKKEIKDYENIIKPQLTKNKQTVSEKKRANWLDWALTIPILIWISPFILVYLIFILIKDIVKFIKSKFGNKLHTNS